MKQKFLFTLLALALCLTLLPTAALAADETEGSSYVAEVNGTGYATFDDALGAAKTGDTIKLLANVEKSSEWTVYNATYTLDLNGHKFDGKIAVGFGYGESGTLTIQDSGTGSAVGSVSGQITASYGSLAITGGNFTKKIHLASSSCTVMLSGGTFGQITVSNGGATDIIGMLADGYAFCYTTGDNMGKPVEQSELKNLGEYDFKNFRVLCCTDHSYDTTTAKCVYCNTACPHASVNADNTCTGCGTPMKVYAENTREETSKYFPTLDSALSGYDRFTLLDNCDESLTLATGQTVSIDLNGHSLTSLTPGSSDSRTTITDSKGNGSIGTLTVVGDMTLSGGSYGSISGASKWILATGYAFQNNTGSMIEYGDITSPLTNVKVVECSHGAFDENHKCDYCGSSIVASITTGTGESAATAYYLTFNDAYTAAASGNTITLLANAVYQYDNSESSTVAWSKSFTVDLGGHTLTTEGGETGTPLMIVSGTITLKNGTVDSTITMFGGNATLNLGDNFTLGEDCSLQLHSDTTLNITGTGVNVSELTVLSSEAKCKLTGGTFGKVSIHQVDANEGYTVGSLLASGYGFRTTGTNPTWYSGSSTETSISNVEVKKLPIQGRVTISSTNRGITYSDINPVSYTYGDSETFTASVTLAEGYTLTGATYAWDNGGARLPDGCTANGNTLSVAFPQAGEYSFACTVTVDGYTATTAYGGQCQVTKATLSTGDYTAPTAKSGLTFGSDQTLVNAGSIKDGISGPTFRYGQKNDSGEMEWGGVRTDYNAGTYTVYWYIEGGTNYQNVGSKENPKGSVEVTIAPMKLTVNSVTVAEQTYTGLKDIDSKYISVVFHANGQEYNNFTNDENTPDWYANGELTDVNVGDNKEVKVQVWLNSDNYIFAGNTDRTDRYDCTATVKVVQAEAPTKDLKAVAVYRTVGSTAPQTVYLNNVGMPADAGTLSYSLTSCPSEVTASVDASTGVLTITEVSGDTTNAYNIMVTISSTNYEDAVVTVTVSLTDKTVPTVRAENITVTYNGSALNSSLIQGTATYDGAAVAGNWSWSAAAPKNVSDSGTFTVIFTPTDTATYSATTTNITVTINKATLPQPEFGKVTEAGHTLGEIGHTVEVSADFTWDDGNDEFTEIEQGVSYGWTLTADEPNNYAPSVITGSVILWPNPSSTPSGSGGGSGSSAATTVTVPVSSDHASVEVKAEVKKGNATVEISDKQIENVIADHAGEVTLDVSGLKNVESATVPAHVVEKTNAAEDTDLTVSLPAGSVTLDETALESVTEAADGKDVTVSAVSVPTTKLPTAVKDIIGMEPTVVAVVDVNVTVNGVKQSSFNGGKLTISIPYTPKSGEDTSKLTVWFIKDDGTIENKGGYYDAAKKCFVFETEHLSQYLLVNTNELVRFTDVSADAWYAAAVNWAVKNEITGGIGNDQFGPDLSCTRAQLVTFLYRAAIAQGVDVSVGKDTNILSYTDALEIPEYAVEAFQWAVGAGIVQGYDGALMPNDDCTRGQIVTMLYRFAVVTGRDVSVGEDTNILSYADFASVPEYAVAPFQWATGAGIIHGADGALMPNDTCTRGQIVTMLYRLLGE